MAAARARRKRYGGSSWHRRLVMLVGAVVVVAITGQDASAATAEQSESDPPPSSAATVEAAVEPLPVSRPRDLAGELAVDGVMPSAGGGRAGEAVAQPRWGRACSRVGGVAQRGF